MRIAFILLVLLISFHTDSQSQTKKLAVIGSSTAFGTGSQPMDSSWVRKINYYYKYQNNIIDSTYNLALGGYDPYHGLPSSYITAPSYSVPDPQRNITKANSFNPDVIIVSFVSNNFQVGAMPTDSIMNAFQVIKDSANKLGHVCFISTTQPRTSFDINSRARLRVIKDSILNRFGFYAINFFDSLVNDIDNSILPEYASPFDNIHLNNAGHAVLYRQVLAKDIFNITTTRTRKSGNFNDPLTWDKGIVPTIADSVAVLPGHTVTITGSAQVRALSVATGANIQVNPGIDFKIGIAAAGLDFSYWVLANKVFSERPTTCLINRIEPVEEVLLRSFSIKPSHEIAPDQPTAN
jgi:hypothetical protein